MMRKGHTLSNREIAAAYAGMATNASMPDWFHQLVLQLRPVREGETALDLGCGPAGTLSYAARQSPSSKYYGLDLCRPELARNDSAPGPIRSVGDARQLPFHPDSFDVVYMTEVLEHTADPAGILRNVRTLLRPGGELVCTLPNAAAYFPFLLFHRRLCRRPLGQYLLPCEYPTRSGQPIDTVLRYGEIMHLLSTGGFRVTRSYGGEPLKYIHDIFKVKGDEKKMLVAERWLERLEKFLSKVGLARCCYRLYLVCESR